jgi:hypothetical protein
MTIRIEASLVGNLHFVEIHLVGFLKQYAIKKAIIKGDNRPIPYLITKKTITINIAI